MTSTYIEPDCVFTAQGRSFEAGGAFVSNSYLVAYPGPNGRLNDWHGRQIGTYRVVSSRAAIFFGRQSWRGARYWFMHATVDGVKYALRGFGEGMIARGNRLKP